MTKQCKKQVYGSGDRAGFGGHRCTRRARVVEDGKGYCNLHSAAGLAKKQKRADERFADYMKSEDAKWAKADYDNIPGDLCRSLGLTLEQIKDPDFKLQPTTRS